MPAMKTPAPQLNWAFLWAHPAHLMALGFGGGLLPKAPGTMGTLVAWVIFCALAPWMNDWGWGVLIAASTLLGGWACLVTARHMQKSDPSAVVWDEIVAFWWILWWLAPASWSMQCAAFLLFRFFDAVKPGPVGWADGLFKQEDHQVMGWRVGFGILFDDGVAAFCTLLVLAVWQHFNFIWRHF
jgi:phosphatidylglycerophosphatase A